MKKQVKITIATIAAITVLALPVVYILSDHFSLASMSKTVEKKATSGTSIGFPAKKGERLKTHYSNVVKEGLLKISLGKDGEEASKVFDLEKNDIVIPIEESSTYVVNTEYEGFVGEFQVKVNK